MVWLAEINAQPGFAKQVVNGNGSRVSKTFSPKTRVLFSHIGFIDLVYD